VRNQMVVIQLGLGANVPYYLCYGLQSMNVPARFVMQKPWRNVGANRLIPYGWESGNPLNVNVRCTRYHYFRFLDGLLEAAHLSRSFPVIVHTHVGLEFRVRILSNIVARAARSVGKRLRLVWHFHGSDIRSGMTRFPSALFAMFPADCNLVSTPDLIQYAKRRHIDAQWLPNPVDPLITTGTTFGSNLIRPAVLDAIRAVERAKKENQIFFVPTRQDHVKGVLEYVDILKSDEYSLRVLRKKCLFPVIAWGNRSRDFVEQLTKSGFRVLEFPILNRYEYIRLLRASDVVMGQRTLGILSYTELEALACGKVVLVGGLSQATYDCYSIKPPVFVLGDENLRSLVEMVSSGEQGSKAIGEEGKEFIERFHEVKCVTKGLISIYQRLIEGT
jgi:hypothetical protein